MAQLKDTVLSGSLRVTDTTYTTTAQVYAVKAPTSSGSTAYGVGTSGNVLHSNGTASYWGALTSGELPAHTHAYLPTSGGTMTGLLNAQSSIYTDSYTGALNMNNSNIYGVNSIITADMADNAGEGLQFYRDTTHVDTLWVTNGNIYFVPYRALGAQTAASSSEKITRLPASITDNQVVLTDSTNGKLKTVATSTWASSATFTGAGASTNGVKGIVPAPTSGQQTYYLRGDGSWASTAHTHNYLPATAADRGLDITSNKVGHTKSLTASANISGTSNVSGWGQVATVAVPSIDAYGHTTACKTKTITMPSSTGLATEAYVNERVANAVHFKGGFNANNADALKTPLKEVGDMYLVSTAGTFYGLELEVGDSIIFQSSVAANTNPTSADFIGVEKTVSVENNGPTLSWGNTSTVGVVEGVNLTVKMPGNPNTDTKVTAVGNHYTPSSSGTFTPAAGGTTTNISGTVVNYIAGLQKDAAGHVTGIVSGSIRADANTDTKVTAVGNHYTPSSSGTFTPAAGGTTTDISTTILNIITGLQKDAAGHITGVVSGSIKATDTKNTAGSTDTSSKIFLIGSTSQTANSQTYSHDTVYVNTDGCLYSDSAKVLTETNNAGFHNSIYRGKSLGTSITDEQWAAISAGTFDDMYIGDYWTLSTTLGETTSNVRYVIAGFDYWWNCGDNFPQSSNKHHIVLVPASNLYSATMNATNITTGGYISSLMYTDNLANARTGIAAVFGTHLYKVKRLFTNAVNSMGQATGWAWYESSVDLMSETMVYGHPVWSSSGFEVGVDRTILPLFALNPASASIRAFWWLRSVASPAYFALVNYSGSAYYYYASNSLGVRPAFAIY